MSKGRRKKEEGRREKKPISDFFLGETVAVAAKLVEIHAVGIVAG